MSDFDQAANSEWDVLVVGAGPAGAVAARQLALKGKLVLLVDRAPLGRKKVCGCCLNVAALKTLESVGLEGLTRQLAAVALNKMQVATKDCSAVISLPGGVSLSREAFDAALIHEAIASGATFLSETNATLELCQQNHREVELTHTNHQCRVKAKIVLAADGLGGKLLSKARHERDEVDEDSRIGAAAILPRAPQWVDEQTVHMACSRRGYVGLVVLEDGRLNVAAALDRNAVRQAGGPGNLAAEILQEVGWEEIDGLCGQPWQGTMTLTRRAASLWDERILVLGDAGGYVEPFTGEGMAWAISSAVAIMPFVLKAVDSWEPRIGAEWERVHRQIIVQRQSTCRLLAHALRHPLLVRAAIQLLHYQPGLARPFVRRLNAS
jgi:menaquinone-9 beta-reductase